MTDEEYRLREALAKTLARSIEIQVEIENAIVDHFAALRGEIRDALRHFPQPVAPKRGRGRPGLGRPWEVEGIGRTAWFARKKALKKRWELDDELPD